MAKIVISKGEEQINNIFEGYKKTELSPRGRKLLKEWRKIDFLCENSDVIKYIIRKRNREGLPVEYEIIYHLNSIIGIEEPVEETREINGENITRQWRRPVYGKEHHLSIVLPNNYPGAFGGNPEFVMITDTWHPNIRATGKFKGRICLNDRDLGVACGLDERIIRVGKYLQYQTYWAIDSYPWPEDQVVAEWVREEAEPAGWVNVNEGIYTDNAKLYKTPLMFQKNYLQEVQDTGLPRGKNTGNTPISLKMN
ncbi:MAG: hypothetical protein R6W71_02080 [Bacteroidales bacterium]|jgi:hypothetical protein